MSDVLVKKRSPLADVQLDLVDNIDKAFELKRWLGERHDGPLGLDTESGGLSPWHSELRLVQIGDRQHGWSIPWPDWAGVVREILNAWRGDWTLHNGPHDVKFLTVHAGWQAPWDRMHDTMTKAGLDNPLRSRALKELGGLLVDRQAALGQRFLDEGMTRQGWTWATVPYDFDPYWTYAALDPVITCHLDAYLSPRVAQACPAAYDLEMGALRVVTNMMLSGVLIDQPYVLEARGKLAAFEAQSRAWLTENHQITSPLSAQQIVRALARYGWEPTEFTDTGKPKMDKDVLKPLRDRHGSPEVREMIRQVLAVRHASKLVGTYLDAFTEKVDGNGRLHGTINPMGARTHRMSSSDPNLQNLPRDDKMIRGAIIPGEGNVLISCDLNQVEARMAAHFSQDAGLIEAFRRADEEGADFFCGIAEGIFGEPISKADHRRQLTKNTVYGSLYGAGAAKMADTAGVPFEVMEPVKRGFDARFPGLKALTRSIMDRSQQYESPRVYLPTGRHLVGDDERAYTQLTNALIQGHSAEYMKRCLLNLEASGLGSYLRLVVHDEAILEVPAGQAEEILRTVEDCMTDKSSYRVSISAEGKIMKDRWVK